MRWQISKKEIKKETKYKIWSTVSDKYITKWMSRDEIMRLMFWRKFNDFVDNFLQDSMCFPEGWTNKKGQYFNGDEFNEFYYFKLRALKDTDLYYKKFEVELNKYGLSVSVSDGESGFESKKPTKNK